jgi:NuA3 HAT complex component NTO1
VIAEGINTAPTPKNEELNLALSTSPSKNTFSDIRERRKLGKRILKAVQPQLEAALKIEAEILVEMRDRKRQQP